jgi:hypothetical protein
MEARLLQRPIIDLFSSRTQCLFSLNPASRRHESSYRRSKKLLNVKPDSSFLLSNKSPQEDHIVFNPPSSAPSINHTPSIFFPKEDKRKQLFAATTAKTPSTRLPPVIPTFKPIGVKHHLNESDIAEIQRLRTQDPFKWTAAKLARKFNCSMFFVKMCCEASKERKEYERKRLEALRARWGPKRTRAREDMLRRKELALKAE